MTQFFFFLVSLLVCSSAHASDPRLSKLRTRYKVPALGGAVVKSEGTKIYMDGIRKFGNTKQAEASDKFHLGSCTKAITATLIALHVEKGDLKWTSTVEELFSSLIPNVHEGFKKVTLEMLLAHRGGVVGDIFSVESGELWKKLRDPKLKPIDGRILVSKAILSAKPASEPGSKFEYSNQGYIIAASALEKLTKKSWEELVRTEVFRPLGMSSCGFGAAGNPNAKSPDQPWPHDFKEGSPFPVKPNFDGDNPPTLGPAGTVHCSLGDWAKFVRLHLDGENGKATKILQADSFKKLHERYPGQDYTYGGWGRLNRKWAGGDTLSHGGSNTMNYANVWIAPRKDAAFLSVTNSGTEDAFTATDEVIGELINETIPKENVK